MDANKEKIRSLMAADVRIGEAYYFFSTRHGVTENELNVLYAMDDDQPHTQQQIVRDWLLPKTTVNTAVKSLVRSGDAELQPQAGSREKRIVLTEAGQRRAREVLQKVYAAERAAMERTCSRYSPEFVEAFGYFAECLLAELGPEGGHEIGHNEKEEQP